MKVGETVLAPVNQGQWVEAEVIEIHGDIVRVSGKEEIRLVRERGGKPLGIGFHVQSLRTIEKAKHT